MYIMVSKIFSGRQIDWASEVDEIGNFFFRGMSVCQSGLEVTDFKQFLWNLAHVFLDFLEFFFVGCLSVSPV